MGPHTAAFLLVAGWVLAGVMYTGMREWRRIALRWRAQSDRYRDLAFDRWGGRDEPETAEPRKGEAKIVGRIGPGGRID